MPLGWIIILFLKIIPRKIKQIPYGFQQPFMNIKESFSVDINLIKLLENKKFMKFFMIIFESKLLLNLKSLLLEVIRKVDLSAITSNKFIVEITGPP